MEDLILDVPSEEQIAQHYSACLDSVALLTAGQPLGMSDVDWVDSVARNKEHLEIMVAKDYWTTEDLTVITAAL
tara:strand:- start:1318 stop:1539 length:222 start_codon:yes stop_codon:yes gene_type:complete